MIDMRTIIPGYAITNVVCAGIMAIPCLQNELCRRSGETVRSPSKEADAADSEVAE